jgi:hypothetical protein
MFCSQDVLIVDSTQSSRNFTRSAIEQSRVVQLDQSMKGAEGTNVVACGRRASYWQALMSEAGMAEREACASP